VLPQTPLKGDRRREIKDREEMNAISTAAILSTALAGTALAGPVLTIQAGVSGYATQTVTSGGVATEEPGRYNYVGGLVSNFPITGWAIGWDLVGDDTSVVPDATFVTNGFTVTNYTSGNLTFDIVVSLATPLAAAPGTLLDCFGNLSGTLTADSSSTATISPVGGAMWQGQVNGFSKLSLNPGTVSTDTVTFIPMSSGDWSGIIPGDSGNLETVGYRLSFTLSGKSTAQFTGLWSGTVVPAPGAFAMLLAAFGLGGMGRRRTQD